MIFALALGCSVASGSFAGPYCDSACVQI